MSNKLLNRFKFGALASLFAVTQALVPAHAALATGAIDISVAADDAVVDEPMVPMAPGTGDQPVWCQYTSGWTAHIGDANSGGNGSGTSNRFPLTQLPNGYNNEKVYMHESGQVWATDRSDNALKAELSEICAQQYVIAIPQPVITPICGVDNDIVTWQESSIYTATNTAWVDGKSTATVTITAGGYAFAGNTKVATFTINELNREACSPAEVAIPSAPQQVDPCGLDNVHWVAGTWANTAEYSWKMSDDGTTLTATVNDPELHVFAGGQTSVGFTLNEDRGERCEVPVPAEPAAIDPCGLNNIRWNSESYANTDDYTWELDGTTLTVSLVDPANYVFANGETSISYELPADRNERCKDDEQPEVPVLGTDTDKPRQAPKDEVPAVLPQTGATASSNSNPLLILLAGALAYGVLYFAQPRREVEAL